MKRPKINFEYSDKRGKLIEICRDMRWSQMNLLTVKKGFSRGGHYHKRNLELFFMIEGKCAIKIVNLRNRKVSRFIAKEKDVFIVEPYQTHYLKGLKDSKMAVLLKDSHDPDRPDIYEP